MLCKLKKSFIPVNEHARLVHNIFHFPMQPPPCVQHPIGQAGGGGASSTARLAIGQAVAILFELGREVDSDLLESAESCETYSLIEQLATESNRYTARKERNQLRAHFRDVLQTLNVRWLASYMSHACHMYYYITCMSVIIIKCRV